MKILISAFECAPNTGSEYGVGWNWSVQLAKMGHEVWVLTNFDSRNKITRAIETGLIIPSTLHFSYIDSNAFGFWGADRQRLIRTHNYFWQLAAVMRAKKLHREIGFDLVHHLTWGVIRQPTLMGLLGLPFVFGPLGGGEEAPWRLLKGTSLRGKILEVLRCGANRLVWIDPLMWITYLTTDRIYARTVDSKLAIPYFFHNRILLRREIGIEPVKRGNIRKNTSQNNKLRFLYAGRLLYWKGLHLGLHALKELISDGVDAELTIVGTGSEKRHLRKLAKKLGITQHIEWLGKLPQQELFASYKNFDALLFPSLHDSGANTVLEAVAHGLPAICLDIGAPPIIVGDDCGLVVKTHKQLFRKVIESLATQMRNVAEPGLRESMTAACIKKGANSSWDQLVKETYSEIAKDLLIPISANQLKQSH